MEKLAYLIGVRRALTKLGLYTQWGKEEPKLRNIGTEDQTGGQRVPTPQHTQVEPASTASPSQPRRTPSLLGQLRPLR